MQLLLLPLYSPRSAGSGPPGGGARTRSLRCARLLRPRRPCPGRRRAAGSTGAGSPSCAAAAAAAGHRLKTERKPRVQEMLRCWAGLGAGHVTSPANGGARPVAGGSVHTRHHQLATSPHREAEGIVMIGLLFIHFNLALFQLFNAAASFHVILPPPSIS